jgi:hypothetical protein
LRNSSIFAGSAIQGLLKQEEAHLLQHQANAVLNPDTGRPMNYEELIRNPKTRALWSAAMTKELARLAQGLDGLTFGTNTVVFMSPDDIKTIPSDRTVAYARIVVNF